MRKLTTLLLVFAVMISIGCKKNPANPMNLTETTQEPPKQEPELITTNGNNASTNPADIAAFINKYAGVYYGEGTHMYQEWGVRETYTGKMVHYKLRNGQVYTINRFNQSPGLITDDVQAAVLPSENKLQISNYAKGTIEVLNLREDGLNAYTSFILEKVSDKADTAGMQLIGTYESLSAQNGTYKSVYDKIDKFLAITENGEVYFHAQGESKLVDNELIVVKDNVKHAIILEQGVYRKLNNNDVDTTTVVCEVTKDFIEDIPNLKKNSKYNTEDFKSVPRWKGDIPQITGFDVCLNEDINGVDMEGSACISGAFGNRYKDKGVKASSDMVAHVTILKGKTLHVMGRYDCELTFSDDWKTLTYEGNTLTLR